MNKPPKTANAKVSAKPSKSPTARSGGAKSGRKATIKQIAEVKLTAQQKLDLIGIEAICVMVADVTPMRTIAANIGVSWATLDKYVNAPERFEQYARAREAQADKMAEDMLLITDRPPLLTATGGVDSGDVANRRLQFDARRWLAGKMAPKKYGDKIAVGGADDMPAIKVERIERVIIDPK